MRANTATIFARGSATIDFCEPNYVHSTSIAEWWGTWSAMAMVLLGVAGMALGVCHGLKAKHVALLLHLTITGAGTMYLHATLAFFGQACDEVPMVITVLSLFYCAVTAEDLLSPTSSAALALGLTAMGVWACDTSLRTKYMLDADAVEPMVFPIIFGALMCLLIVQELRLYWNYAARRLRRLYEYAAVTFVLGFGVWVVDQRACSSVQAWQLHAWWHVLTALSAHFTFIWVVAIDAEVHGDGLPHSLLESGLAVRYYGLGSRWGSASADAPKRE